MTSSYTVGHRVLSFSQVVGIGTPQPLTRRRVCPPPPGSEGGAHSLRLAREGLGESQFRRGDIHCGTLYINLLCAVGCQFLHLLGWRGGRVDLPHSLIHASKQNRGYCNNPVAEFIDL